MVFWEFLWEHKWTDCVVYSNILNLIALVTINMMSTYHPPAPVSFFFFLSSTSSTATRTESV